MYYLHRRWKLYRRPPIFYISEPELSDGGSRFVATLEERRGLIFGAEGWGARLHAERLSATRVVRIVRAARMRAR